jgi:hypothetical protein
MLESPQFHGRSPLQATFFNDREASKELSPTTDLKGSTETKSFSKKQHLFAQTDLSSKFRRSKRIISIEDDKKIKRKSIFKGLKDDTTDLNTNFKTLL